MPLYDYACNECGRFRAWRAMAEAAAPADCPGCGTTAPRAVTAPNLAILGRSTRIAHERNERSAHEPAVMQRSQMGPPSKPHHHHRPDPRRAWMIGH